MANQFSLNHLASFSITGPDALIYAQSQFTVSVDSLSGMRFSPLAWCDPKGRVLAVMLARTSDDHIHLVVPALQADSVRERLQRFTIGRRVEVSATAPVAGIFEPGDQAPALSFDADRGMLAATEAPADPGSLERWQRLDLCRGLPWLDPHSSGQHLPQWLGLEELGALAWDKGCYPGQEVIARLHYRGSVKYRLAGLKLDGPVTFEGHERITDRDGARVGRWLGGLQFEDGTIGLAVLAKRVENGDEVVLHDGESTRSARVTPHETLC